MSNSLFTSQFLQRTTQILRARALTFREGINLVGLIVPHLVQGLASKVKENKRRKEEEKIKGKLGFQVVRESRLETLPNSIFVCFRVALG